MVKKSVKINLLKQISADIYETITLEHLYIVTFNTFAAGLSNIRGRKFGVCIYIIYWVCNKINVCF